MDMFWSQTGDRDFAGCLKNFKLVWLVWPEVRFQKLPLPERKSEGNRAMVSVLGVPTVQWQHWHHPTIQPSFGLPSFDGSCLLAICRPLPRAVEVRNTVWAAVSAPHGGGDHYPGETCGMLVKRKGHFPRFLFKKDELVDLSCANSQRICVSKNKLMSDGIWPLTFQHCPVTCRTLLCKEFCIDESN